jgi:endonuclease YncB( thermonuclease family)
MNETFLSAEIVDKTYGLAYNGFLPKHMEELRQSEGEARENKRGLWRK